MNVLILLFKAETGDQVVSVLQKIYFKLRL